MQQQHLARTLIQTVRVPQSAPLQASTKSHHIHAQPFRAIHQTRQFHRAAVWRIETEERSTRKPGGANPTIPGLSKFSFEALGIRGWTKWSIIGVFSVLSTLETIFWVKVCLRWWRGEKDGNEEEESS